jgi:hypothetical protein
MAHPTKEQLMNEQILIEEFNLTELEQRVEFSCTIYRGVPGDCDPCVEN